MRNDLLLAQLFVTLVACDPRSDGDAGDVEKTHKAERLNALANVDLRPLEGEAGALRFASAIVGLRTFEVVTVDDTGVTASPLATFDAPTINLRHPPPFVWPLDVDCDGREDIALGGAGEAYVVRAQAAGGYGPRENWDLYLPPGIGTGAFDQRLVFEDLAMIIPYSSVASVQVYTRRLPDCTWSKSADVATYEAPLAGNFAPVWQDGDTGFWVLFQDWLGTTQSLSLAAESGDPANFRLTSGDEISPEPSPPYLMPFAGIDAAVTLAERPGCARRALGVGRVPAGAASSPAQRAELQRIQLFSVLGDSYGWVDLPDTSNVEAYGVFDGGAESPSYVGAIRSMPAGAEFQLIEVSDCDTFRPIANAAIEFDWKTPPAPLHGILESEGMQSGSQPGFIPQYDYPMLLPVKLDSVSSAKRLIFAHYDGYDVRVFKAVENQGTWSISSETTKVHEVRDDLAFPFTEDDLDSKPASSAGVD